MEFDDSASMTHDQFRSLVLSCPDSEEKRHHSHPDFRVQGKIFATLGYPDNDWAMVKLTPEQQTEFMHDHPGVFAPSAGAWGRQGSTCVLLSKARKAALQNAVKAAWQNARAGAQSRRRGKPAKL